MTPKPKKTTKDSEIINLSEEVPNNLVLSLRKALDANAFPGAVIFVEKNLGKSQFIHALGNRSLGGSDSTLNVPMHEDMIFDLGEITTLFCTASILMILIKEGKCSPNDLVSRFLQGFSVNGKSPISIKNILTSQSGLISSYPFYEEIYKNSHSNRIGMLASRGAKEYVLNYIVRSNLKCTPNTKTYYSEVAIILLGFLVEAICGNTLDKVFLRKVADPLGLCNTGFIDLALLKSKKLSPNLEYIAPTENCDWRGKTLCAEVENDNAWAIGGIAGNAGLFSCAREVNLFAREILKALKGKSNLFDKHITSEFLGVFENLPPYLWERPNKENGMLNIGFSKFAVGINSFTGCSLWIDPEKEISVTLLTNRTHPSKTNKKISTYRPQIFQEALKLAES